MVAMKVPLKRISFPNVNNHVRNRHVDHREQQLRTKLPANRREPELHFFHSISLSSFIASCRPYGHGKASPTSEFGRRFDACENPLGREVACQQPAVVPPYRRLSHQILRSARSENGAQTGTWLGFQSVCHSNRQRSSRAFILRPRSGREHPLHVLYSAIPQLYSQTSKQ